MLYTAYVEITYIGGREMQHDIITQITESLERCTDPSLLDLIYKLLIESGY